MAAPGSTAPRKFSEKIALQKQRQAEETAAFVEVMADLSSARVQVQKLRVAHMRGSYYGGSLPNVNQIASGSHEFQGPPQSPLDPTRSTRHHGLVERVTRDPRRMMSPLRRFMRQVDSSPYSASHLSPHLEGAWRRNWGSSPSDPAQLFRLPSALNRTNSDSALHTSVMNPSAQEPYPPAPQGAPSPARRNAFPFPSAAMEEAPADGAHLLKPYDAKKLSSASGRPKSCEVPGINIYPSADLPPTIHQATSILNSGGSLPDLTNLHFPSPLPTPLDPEESGHCGLSGGSSTGNLTSTMTHLGISRSAFPAMMDSPGFSSSSGFQNSLSRQSLQSSLSNPNLQASLNSGSLQTSFSNPSLQSLQSSLSNPNLQASLGNSASLQTSLSNPSLQSSLSSQSLPSSLSNQSLSPSASNQSLASAYSTPSSPPSSASPSSYNLASASLTSSPRRRVPLSPLTLPMAADGRRPHQKQYSPTMSPTLTSITQGVPLDTSRMSSDPRLPPYHFGLPGLLLQSPQQMSHSQQPLQQSSQPMANSHPSPQQPLAPPSQHMDPSHSPQSQMPFHQSQNAFSQTPSQSSLHPSNQTSHHRGAPEASHKPPYKELPMPPSAQSFYNSYQHILGDYQLGSSLLSSLFDECDQQLSSQRPGTLSQQLEQCNMAESRRLGLMGEYSHMINSGTGPFTSPAFRKQSSSNGSRHDTIPNIILTAVDSPPGFSKEITAALSCVPGFEVDPGLGLDEELNIEPLTVDGLNMLSDPFAPLTDPLVEDSFRSDRL